MQSREDPVPVPPLFTGLITTAMVSVRYRLQFSQGRPINCSSTSAPTSTLLGSCHRIAAGIFAVDRYGHTCGGILGSNGYLLHRSTPFYFLPGTPCLGLCAGCLLVPVIPQQYPPIRGPHSGSRNLSPSIQLEFSWKLGKNREWKSEEHPM